MHGRLRAVVAFGIANKSQGTLDELRGKCITYLGIVFNLTYHRLAVGDHG